MPKSKTFEGVVQGKVLANVVPEHERRMAARRHLAKLRRNGARIIGDIVKSPNDAWDAKLK